MIASTLTGTVSLVSACSALKAVVWMRPSITATTLSRIGMIANRPAPLTLCSFPILRMTNFSHTLAILIDKAITAAAPKKTIARYGLTQLPTARPAKMQAATRNAVMEFMIADPQYVRSCPDQGYGPSLD